VEESIRVFVRVADPKFRQIVPMRYFNLMLSPSEVEAYTADYLEEASSRAGTGRMVLRVVAVIARITTELEELKRSQNSPSVWKLHADSLVVLLDLAQRLSGAVERLAMEIAQQPDMKSRSDGLCDTLGKLQERTGQVVKILAQA